MHFCMKIEVFYYKNWKNCLFSSKNCQNFHVFRENKFFVDQTTVKI